MGAILLASQCVDFGTQGDAGKLGMASSNLAGSKIGTGLRIQILNLNWNLNSKCKYQQALSFEACACTCTCLKATLIQRTRRTALTKVFTVGERYGQRQ